MTQLKYALLTITACALFQIHDVLAENVYTVPSAGIKTINEAMIKAMAGDSVIVKSGVYREHVIVKSGVALVNTPPLSATIDGGGKGTTVKLGKGSSVEGFTITNGTIGIFVDNAGVSISKCRIIRNWQTGIITVRHLPRIEDNVIAFNRASGIQGWDVRSTIASINHNTIAFNGNHGIAVGGRSNIILENNTIAFNERYGLKLSEESDKSSIIRNNFYGNLLTWKELPKGNFAFDPAFIAPRSTLNFNSDPKECCTVKGTDNQNIGARGW